MKLKRILLKRQISMKKKLKLGLHFFLFALLPFVSVSAQQTQSDNGDGTYTNPVIYSDFPDPDVIRVDSIYYMVSTTMFIFPGVTILKSYDLVNWEYCCNAVQRMDFHPYYNLDGGNRYSHGQWATSLKYHNGTYYLLFITLDEGGFLCTAKKPEGPWKIKHLPRGFYDPGLFFDDDGKIYVAHGYSKIYMTELNENFVAKSSDRLVFEGDIRPGLEGAHVYKINGYYYLYCTYGGGDGFQVALRSKNIYGPYEQKVVIRDNSYLGTGLHQGALIQTQTGEWWTLIFQDGGAFGRFPSLQPVTWVDDWPMVGVNGKGVITYRKPDVGKEYPIKVLPTSSEFDSTELGMQWGWNHNPDSTKWSLTENPGYLRLSTVKVVSSLPEARNTLTQRIFAYYSRTFVTTATVKMNIDNMQDGDIAGLAVFQDPYAFIGIKNNNGEKYVVMVNNGKAIDSTVINSSTVYLRAMAKYGTSRASFAYGFDNQSFTALGNQLAMRFNLTIFTGNKFCLFNYATIATGGFVDFDWFRIDLPSQTDVTPEEEQINYNYIPQGFSLGQNYPNPFNPTTVIPYQLTITSKMSLKVYDLLGQEIATLFEGVRQPGTYEATFNGGKLASGVYFYRLQTTQFSLKTKMLIIK
jgi:beta-xylosidase